MAGFVTYDDITLDVLRKRTSMKWRGFPPEVLPAWVAEMDFPLAEPIARVLHEMVDRGDTGYVSGRGVGEAFAEFSLRHWGFAPDASRSAVLQDIMRGVLVALYELTPRHGGVAFLVPAYPPFFETIEYAERRVVTVPMPQGADGRYGIDFELLEQTLVRPDVSTFLLCNPHNPTGRVFTLGELTTIAEICNRHGILVLSDEVHGPLVYEGCRHIPYGSLGELAHNSVSFVSASKAWNVPGLKCAVAFAHGPETWKAFEHLPIEIEVGASPFGIAANIAAFTEGAPWLDETLAYLQGNRDYLASALKESLPGIAYAVPEATYLAWLDCRALGFGDNPANVFLQRGRVALNPGLDYCEVGGRGFARLNFATPRPILEQIVARMAMANPS